MDTLRITPSILSANFVKLGEEASNVTGTGTDLIHLDVVDSYYAPNLTVRSMVCSTIKPYATIPVDIHLITKPVDDLIQSFGKTGTGVIAFHPEASKHTDHNLNLVRNMGCQAGLVLGPATPANLIENALDELDMILLMLANPGFGGQNFIPYTLIKIRQVKGVLDNCESQTGWCIALEVNGGIKTGDIAEVATTGTGTFVVGSAIFNQSNYKAVIDEMRKKLAKV